MDSAHVKFMYTQSCDLDPHYHARHHHSGHPLLRPHLIVKDVIVAEPFEKSLPVHDGRAGVVPNVKSARHVVAAVAIGCSAIAITVRVAGRLLLVMVKLTAVGFVDGVALLGVPGAFGLEFDVPIAVSRVLSVDACMQDQTLVTFSSCKSIRSIITYIYVYTSATSSVFRTEVYHG